VQEGVGKVCCPAKRAQSKIERTVSMVLYYLASHDPKKIESHEFTLKRNKNSPGQRGDHLAGQHPR